MNKLVSFFLPKDDLFVLERQKSVSLIVTSYILLFLDIFLFVYLVMFNNTSEKLLNLILSATGGTFLIINLFLLRRFGIKLAGNLMAFVLVFFEVITMNALTPGNVLTKYNDMYFVSGLFAIGLLFANRSVLLINALLILISGFHVFFYSIHHYPEKFDNLIRPFFFFVISFTILSIIVILSHKLAENAINVARNEEQLKRKNELLLRLINAIKHSSHELLGASEQLSDISQQMSTNTSEQAATTEEISTSAEEMVATISANTEKAALTAKESEDAANELKEANQTILQVLNFVTEISKTITIITEIAKKTDILSINASIEASKAGEAGKGFAVVAQEIRKLADQTRKASESITQLAVNGQSISQQVRSKLDKLIPQILNNVKLINEIAVASKEQQLGAEQINASIQQLSEITNQNAATAEEMSTAAEQLAAQAEQLRNLVSEAGGNI